MSKPRVSVAALICVLLLSAWVDLSRFHAGTKADALIPVLASLYAWEPFFWDQARVGLLWPLLAMPIDNPWHNLLFQSWLFITSGLGSVALLRLFLEPRGRFASALASVGALLLLAPPSILYSFLSPALPYGTGLALGLGALLTLRSTRRGSRPAALIALVFSVLAHWVNTATSFLLVPLVLAGRLLNRRHGKSDLRTIQQIAILGTGFLAGHLLAFASGHPLVHARMLPAQEWMESWRRLGIRTLEILDGPWGLFLAIGLSMGVGSWIRAWLARDDEGQNGAERMLILASVGLVYWLMVGSSAWVRTNLYHPRYAIPSFICWHVAACIGATLPFRISLEGSDRRRRAMVALAFAVIAIASKYGFPSSEVARDSLDQRLNADASSWDQANVSHLLGSYGWVWPRVFALNALRYERGTREPVWGLTARSGATRHLWNAVPLERWRVGTTEGQVGWKKLARIGRQYGFPDLIPAEVQDERVIYVAREANRSLSDAPSTDLLHLPSLPFSSDPVSTPGAPLAESSQRILLPARQVVLISIDSLRADHLGTYGYHRATSPHIDALGRDGIVFEDAISTTSWTLPSHLSLLTGLYPRTHGVLRRTMKLADRARMLPEILSQEGFRCAGFVSGPYLSARFGFDRGFSRYEDVAAFDSHRDSHSGATTAAVHEAAASWLEEHHEQPFFLFLHYWDVHFDFEPPPPWDTAFDPGYEGTITGREFETGELVHREMERRDLEHVIALYDGEIAAVDQGIGDLLAVLEDLGIYESSLIVLTADHGDEFFEHGSKGHMKNLFQETLAVPLIIKLPRGEEAGRRVTEPVSLVDVFPTLLELIQLETPSNIDGRSLEPLLRGEPLSQVPLFASLTERFGMIRRGSLKYVTRRDEEQSIQETWLFHLATDPTEKRNLQSARPEIAEKMHRELEEWSSSGERTLATERVDVLDEKTRARLEALGYLE